MKVEVKTTEVEKEVVSIVKEEVKEIVLTLSEQEANHLCVVVGNITGGDSFNPNSIRYTTRNIFHNLNDLVNRTPSSLVIDSPMVLKQGA